MVICLECIVREERWTYKGVEKTFETTVWRVIRRVTKRGIETFESVART